MSIDTAGKLLELLEINSTGTIRNYENFKYLESKGFSIETTGYYIDPKINTAVLTRDGKLIIQRIVEVVSQIRTGIIRPEPNNG